MNFTLALGDANREFRLVCLQEFEVVERDQNRKEQQGSGEDDEGEGSPFAEETQLVKSQ